MPFPYPEQSGWTDIFDTQPLFNRFSFYRERWKSIGRIGLSQHRNQNSPPSISTRSYVVLQLHYLKHQISTQQFKIGSSDHST